jgi:hypothetical protein
MTYDEQGLFQVKNIADRVWHIYDLSEDDPEIAAVLDDSSRKRPRSNRQLQFEAQAMALGLYEAYETAFLETHEALQS